MKKIGIIAIIGALGITITLWILSKQNLAEITSDPYTTLGQIAGLLAATLASGQFVLASRWKPVENAFGGLDKVYKAHAWTGAFSFLLMLSHPLFFIISALPDYKLAKIYLLPLGPASYLYGQLALLLFIILISLTLFIKLPYDVWKRTHTFMVLAQGFVFLHVLNIDSDVSIYQPLRWWMLGITSLGLIAYGYIKFVFPFTYKKYRVTGIRFENGVAEAQLTPLNQAFAFTPGQFVLVSFRNSPISKEMHPFTISSGPEDKTLRLSMKMDGDWTSKLSWVKPGATARVFGPYGQFGEKSLTRRNDDIWIAGGIGVTPFLSLLRHYSQHNSHKTIWFFYSVSEKETAVYLEEVSRLAQSNPNIKFIPVYSSQSGRLTAERVLLEVKELKGKQIMMCGPQVMMQDLWSQFVRKGVKPRNIIAEEFNFI